MSDPVRLLRSSRDGMTRTLLESAVTPGPTNSECDELWSSLGKKLPQAVVVGAAGGALAANAATSKAVGLGLLVKGAIVVGVVGSLAAVGIARPWSSRSEALPPAVASASVAPVRSPNTTSSVVAPVAAPPAPQPVADEPAPPPVAPITTGAPRASAARKPPSSAIEAAPAPPVEIESALRGESASLLRGRQLLRSGDCDAALAQLKDTAARFPGGALAQEREVLSIEALACSGRAAEASSRAEAFVRDYPTSPHAGKVRRFTR